MGERVWVWIYGVARGAKFSPRSGDLSNTNSLVEMLGTRLRSSARALSTLPHLIFVNLTQT